MSLFNSDLFVVQRGDGIFKVTADKVAANKKVTTADVETLNVRPRDLVNPFEEIPPDDIATQQDVNWFLYDRTTGTANTFVGEDPPDNPVEGDLWWSTTEGNLFLWYNDGDSAQWVDASPAFVEIDYTKIEAYIDQSVRDNAVAQIRTDGIITVSPVDGKGEVTIGADITSLIDADKDLQDAIDAEEAARIAADQALQTEINLRVTIAEFEADQARQDALIETLENKLTDLADRLDQLEDQVNNVKTIDGGYPNAEGDFDQPESEWVDGGDGVNDIQTPMDPIADGGANNAEGYD